MVAAGRCRTVLRPRQWSMYEIWWTQATVHWARTSCRCGIRGQVGWVYSSERRGREAALLRAVVHQAVFADVEVPRAGAASPVVRLAVGDGFLEIVDARVMLLVQLLHFVVDTPLLATQRLQLAAAIVNDADGRGEAELYGAPCRLTSASRVVDAAAHNGVDVDVKFGVLGQQLELLVEHLRGSSSTLIGLTLSMEICCECSRPARLRRCDAIRRPGGSRW